MGYYVYIHTCKDNGKKYVGVTGRNPESRWKEGRGYKTNKHFYSAILKYGWTNFEHEVFEVESEEEMYRKEVELISFYHSNDPEFGYNNSSGGEYSHLGCKYSEEHRKHLSEVQKKVHSDPEFRKKLSEAQKKVQKKVHSDPEYRKKASEVHKKKWLDPEYREKMLEANRKSHSDPEYRKKVSKDSKKKWLDPEFRRKVSESLRGKPRSAEYRKHIAEAAKNRPKIKIKLPDGTIVEVSKHILTRWYINKGKKFEYVD